MPQLDPSGFASQIFWLTICFVVLYVLLARKLLPVVQSVIAFRAKTISTDIELAKRMKADAEMAREHYEKALAHARARAQKMLSEAQAEIAERTQKAYSDLANESEQKYMESQKAIDKAKREAMGKLTAAATELTANIVETIVQNKPDPKKLDELVSAICKERRL